MSYWSAETYPTYLSIHTYTRWQVRNRIWLSSIFMYPRKYLFYKTISLLTVCNWIKQPNSLGPFSFVDKDNTRLYQAHNQKNMSHWYDPFATTTPWESNIILPLTLLYFVGRRLIITPIKYHLATYTKIIIKRQKLTRPWRCSSRYPTLISCTDYTVNKCLSPYSLIFWWCFLPNELIKNINQLDY